MLSGLRQGAPLFVLYKDDLKVAIGEVVSVTPYVPVAGEPLQAIGALSNFQRLINISVNIDGQNILFTRMNGDASAAGQQGDRILVSETRDGILNELAGMKANSTRILEQVEMHKNIVSKCDKLALELSPQLKKEQEQAEEIASLKNDIAELKAMLASSLNAK